MKLQFLALILLLNPIILPTQAREWGIAQSQYQSPDIGEYYSSLRQPDSPTSSCCGAADAYWTDDSVTINGQLYAIITDTRPDEIEINGRKYYRPHIAVGTKIPIPPNKIRKHPIPNPDEHGIVFVGASGMYEGADSSALNSYYYVYCYEPLPKM